MEKCAGLPAGLHGSPKTFHGAKCGNAISIRTRVQTLLKKNEKKIVERFCEKSRENYIEIFFGRKKKRTLKMSQPPVCTTKNASIFFKHLCFLDFFLFFCLVSFFGSNFHVVFVPEWLGKNILCNVMGAWAQTTDRTGTPEARPSPARPSLAHLSSPQCNPDQQSPNPSASDPM